MQNSHHSKNTHGPPKTSTSIQRTEIKTVGLVKKRKNTKPTYPQSSIHFSPYLIIFRWKQKFWHNMRKRCSLASEIQKQEKLMGKTIIFKRNPFFFKLFNLCAISSMWIASGLVVQLHWLLRWASWIETHFPFLWLQLHTKRTYNSGQIGFFMSIVLHEGFIITQNIKTNNIHFYVKVKWAVLHNISRIKTWWCFYVYSFVFKNVTGSLIGVSKGISKLSMELPSLLKLLINATRQVIATTKGNFIKLNTKKVNFQVKKDYSLFQMTQFKQMCWKLKQCRILNLIFQGKVKRPSDF